eukprot:45099-Amphidinium_carterae.1
MEPDRQLLHRALRSAVHSKTFQQRDMSANGTRWHYCKATHTASTTKTSCPIQTNQRYYLRSLTH